MDRPSRVAKRLQDCRELLAIQDGRGRHDVGWARDRGHGRDGARLCALVLREGAQVVVMRPDARPLADLVGMCEVLLHHGDGDVGGCLDGLVTGSLFGQTPLDEQYKVVMTAFGAIERQVITSDANLTGRAGR